MFFLFNTAGGASLFMWAGKAAWTVAVKSSNGSYIWPDGTYLNTSVFNGVDGNFLNNGPASVLKETGVLFLGAPMTNIVNIPALCTKLYV